MYHRDFGSTQGFWCQASIVSVVNVQTEKFDSECREAAIGSSPGLSDDELSESSGTRGFAITTVLATSYRFSNPIEPAESQFDGCGLSVVGRASNVVGCAGCDSVEMSEVVNRLLVADGRGFFNPGLRLARKASLRSPGATSGRQLRGSRR